MDQKWVVSQKEIFFLNQKNYLAPENNASLSWHI